MDEVFHALAHEVRRNMVSRLRTGELSVSELARPLPMSLEAASKHVQVLERAGLVTRRKIGRSHLCRLEPQGLAPATRWLTQLEAYWSERLDALERVLTDDAPSTEHPGTTDDATTTDELSSTDEGDQR